MGIAFSSSLSEDMLALKEGVHARESDTAIMHKHGALPFGQILTNLDKWRVNSVGHDLSDAFGGAFGSARKGEGF